MEYTYTGPYISFRGVLGVWGKGYIKEKKPRAFSHSHGLKPLRDAKPSAAKKGQWGGLDRWGV